jgi:hypothetical protein
MNQVNRMLSQYISSCQNKDLSEALRKWKGLIISLSNKGAARVGEMPEDFLQDFMVVIVQSDSYHKSELYRSGKSLYKKDREFEHCTMLAQHDFSKAKKNHLIVRNEDLEEVRKCKYNTFIYRRIIQSYKNLITSYFSAKKGYECKIVKKKVLVRSNSSGMEMETRNIRKIRKFVEEVSIFDGDLDNESSGLTPEDYLLREEELFLKMFPQ